MRKFGKILLGFIVLDYVRISALQTYNVMMRINRKNETWKEAMKKTAPIWKDEVRLYSEEEEEV